MSYLTIANYALVFALWTAILALYLRHRRVARAQDPLVATLLGILALDALKNSVENAFFGIVWAHNYGIGFHTLGELFSRPSFLIAPKLLNTFVAITVVAVVIQRWIPNELRARRERDAERDELLEALERSLAEVRGSEERWQLAVRATADGIFDLDVVEDRLWLSDAYCDRLGYSPGELPAANREDLIATFHPDDRPAFAAFLDGIIAAPQVLTEIELRQRTADGRDRDVLVHVCALRDDHGPARRLIGARSDITERNAARTALELQQRTESLGLLASGIAHDFNNLLAIMQLNAEVLRRVAPGEPMEDLHAAIGRAQDLTKRLLAYSGRGNAVIAEIDIGALASELARLMRSSMPTGVQLEVRAEPSLPRVLGDTAQLQQVVMNLLKNATDAVGAGPGTITIALSRVDVAGEDDAIGALTPGTYVALAVTDTGSGMTEEVRARIFDPLYTTKATGHGLGLSAVLGILRAHRGGIRVASKPGAGTTMTVLLPARGV